MNSHKVSVNLLILRVLVSLKPIKKTAGALGIIDERASLGAISISSKSQAVLPGEFQHSPDGNIKPIRAEECSLLIPNDLLKNCYLRCHGDLVAVR